MLKCGQHKCPSSCHQLFDHSKILCKAVLKGTCSTGHKLSWKCHAGAPLLCFKCELEKKEAERKAQRDLEEKIKRDEMTRKHLREVSKIDEEIERIVQEMKDAQLNKEQQAVLAQRRADLAAAKERATNTRSTHQQDAKDVHKKENSTPEKAPPGVSSKPSEEPSTSPDQHSEVREPIQKKMEHKISAAQTEWQRQKDQENANNPAIDKIMEMIGLEDVKAQVLKIKAKVETSIRQATDLKKERLGLVLLGNPGTGISQLLYPCYFLTMDRKNHRGSTLCSSPDIS